MKLDVNLKDKNKKKRKIILISLGVIVLVSVSFLLYKSFASFTENVEFPMMKGKVDYFGNSDVYFAFYQGDKELEEMPQKDNKEKLVFDHAECDNGASIEWNESEWAPLVKNLRNSKTKCSLYFGYPRLVDYIKTLSKTDTTNIIVDDTDDKNIRYIGASPNNYIDIGDRASNGQIILWRIIGVMNNITTLNGEEKQESVIKIIRNDSIGGLSWDSSASDVNSGKGINEWSQADLMKLLNPKETYLDEPEIGASLFWENKSGLCYAGTDNKNGSCNYISGGISKEAREKLTKVRWNTGTYDTYDSNLWTASATYEAENSGTSKKICTSSSANCTDEVERKPTWDGYIGLMHASDYGYAVGKDVRDICLSKGMNSYGTDKCNENDWLIFLPGHWQWTLTTTPHKDNATYVLRLANGALGPVSANVGYSTHPAGYLLSSTIVIDGDGSDGNPYVIANNS